MLFFTPEAYKEEFGKTPAEMGIKLTKMKSPCGGTVKGVAVLAEGEKPGRFHLSRFQETSANRTVTLDDNSSATHVRSGQGRDALAFAAGKVAGPSNFFTQSKIKEMLQALPAEEPDAETRNKKRCKRAAASSDEDSSSSDGMSGPQVPSSLPCQSNVVTAYRLWSTRV